MTPTSRAVEHLPLKPLTYSILLALADGEGYGYGIVKRISEASAGAITIAPSNLYHVLDRLCGQGLLHVVDRPGAEDARRTYFGLTPLGRDVLRAETRRLSEVLRTAEALHMTAEG